MAVVLSSTSDFLSRSSSLLALSTTNRTVCVWAKRGSPNSGSLSTIYAGADGRPVTTDQGGLFVDTSQQPTLHMERAGGFFLTIDTNVADPENWVHYAWVKAGTSHTFYVNGQAIGSPGTLDMTAAVTAIELIGNNGGDTVGDKKVAYYRSWSSALTGGQIQAEMFSNVPVVTANLFQDTPLLSDPNDDSGNGRNWTENGSVAYDGDTPLPPNPGWESATDVGTLPATIEQRMDQDGVTFVGWWKLTAPAGVNTINVWAFSGLTDGSGYEPFLSVFLASEATYITGLNSALGNYPNRPAQIPVTPGETYYFQVYPNGSFVPSNLTFSIIAGPDPNTVVPISSLFVNDDANGFGGAFISTTTDQDVLRFQYAFPAGEGIDTLRSSGRVLVADRNADDLKLYDGQLATVLATVAFSASPNVAYIRANQTSSTFYVAQRRLSGNSAVSSVDNDGNVASLTTVGSNGLSAFAVNDDETIVYMAGDGFNDSRVRQWNVAGSSFGSDLAAAVSGYKVTDLLFLADGTLLVQYVRTSSPGDVFVRRYDTSGTLLNTYTAASSINLPGVGFGYRLAFGPDGTSFWVWWHEFDENGEQGISRFRRINLADGAVITDRTFTEYSTGAYTLSQTDDPVREGISPSCGFIAMGEQVEPPPPPEGFGTLVVIKQTNPQDSPVVFDFEAGGGLDPATFTLTDGQQQTYTPISMGSGYSIVEVNIPNGWTESYEVSNASSHTNITVGDQETVIVTVTNSYSIVSAVVEEEDIRWLRRAPHINRERMTNFFSRFQLDCEQGVGLPEGQGVDPQIMLRYSNDGGHTWSSEMWASAGRQGQHAYRTQWFLLGSGRDRVFEVSGSDPVIVNIVDAYLDTEPGTY